MSLNIFPVEGGVISNATTMLNENFSQVNLRALSVMGSADNTTESLSSSVEAGETIDWTTKRTLSIGANDVNEYVIIRGDLECYNSNSASSIDVNASAYLQITVDSVEILSTNISSNGRNRAEGRSRGFCIKFTPSASQKSNGFTIDLDLKLIRGSSSGSTTGVSANSHYWEVWGV